MSYRVLFSFLLASSVARQARLELLGHLFLLIGKLTECYIQDTAGVEKMVPKLLSGGLAF